LLGFSTRRILFSLEKNIDAEPSILQTLQQSNQR